MGTLFSLNAEYLLEKGNCTAFKKLSVFLLTEFYRNGQEIKAISFYSVQNRGIEYKCYKIVM